MKRDYIRKTRGSLSIRRQCIKKRLKKKKKNGEQLSP